MHKGLDKCAKISFGRGFRIIWDGKVVVKPPPDRQEIARKLRQLSSCGQDSVVHTYGLLSAKLHVGGSIAIGERIGTIRWCL